jgi:hypothetical protein
MTELKFSSFLREVPIGYFFPPNTTENGQTMMQMFRIAAIRLPVLRPAGMRLYSSAPATAPGDLDEKEKHIYEKLAKELTPSKLEVGHKR